MSRSLRVLELRALQGPAGRVPASATALAASLRATAAVPLAVLDGVRAIVADVRARGDAAVRELTARFDGPDLEDPFLSDGDWDVLAARCPSAVRLALDTAARRVRAFHRPQLPPDYEQRLPEGGRLVCRTVPLGRAACYVPGGRAAYPSTVIMTAAVARLAGVPEVIVATPPRRDGSILPEVAAAARIAGATRIYRAGGAQAVAALALGTARVARVDCIVGPGNAWVTEAKRLLSGEVKIDSLAGPTEVVIVADNSARPDWIAADLIAQAEHDPLALALLVTPDAALAAACAEAVDRALEANPSPVAREALEARGAALVADSLEEALALADSLAPEHLQLVVRDPAAALPRVTRAAAVFVGPFTPVPVGDYLAGPNHTLPTSGTARFSSPLSAEVFVRRQNVLEYPESQLAADAPAIATLATAEGLPAHARSVLVRNASAGGPESEPYPPEAAIRASVRPIAAYGPPRDPARVALHLNESPGDLPTALKQQLVDELRDTDWSKYPITEGARLAGVLARSVGHDPAGVLVGNGSNELLQLLLLCAIEPGDAVVVAAPSFSLYALQTKALGAQAVEVPLRDPGAPFGSPFTFPIGPLVHAARESSAKLVLLGSPNNPTGTTLPLAGLERLLRETSGLVGVDEAYRDFSDQDFGPLLAREPRLVLFRTFSKALAGASLRCGALFGAPSLVRELHKIQLPYNLSAFTCRVAEALVQRPALVAERVALVRQERARVGRALEALGCVVHPSGANFLLFEQEQRPSRELHAALFAHGVLIRDFSSHPLLGRSLRVSIGAADANDAFLAAVRAELGASWKGRGP
jgi:histidinol dehydrogenase